MDVEDIGLFHSPKRNAVPPIITALLLQLVTLGCVVLALYLLWRSFGVKLSLTQVVLVQALVVLCLTRLTRLDWWWSTLQPLLPLCMLVMHSVAIPSWCYLLLFLFFLLSYWSTFQTRVPYFPSTLPVWNAIDGLLPLNQPISFVDIGSGFGGLVLHLAKRRPESQFCGVEIAPVPWLVSFLRIFHSNLPVRFIRSNYEQLNFAEFDVVFAYLSPAVMPAVWMKVTREMKKGALFISYEFPIPQVEADLCIYPEKSVINNATIFIWRI